MMDLYVYVLLTILTFCYLWFLYQKSDYKRMVNMARKLPGPKPFPIIGNLNLIGYFSKMDKRLRLSVLFQTRLGLGKLFKDKKMYCIWLGRRPVVNLFAAESVEPLLRSNVLLDKGDFYKFLVPWLGDGLLLSKGNKWRRHRKLLTPTFHFRILDSFLTVMNEQTLILVEKIRDASRGKEWVDVFHYLSMCALDIICETAMGIRIGAQDDSESEYVKAVEVFLEKVALRGPRPWLRFDFIYFSTKEGRIQKKALKVLHSFTETVIRERLASRVVNKEKPNVEEPQAKKKLAFLDLLLEQAEGDFTPEELREQVDTFMFAGHDTTSTALSWVFYLLGHHPEVQDRLLEEVDYVFQGDKTRYVTQEDMRSLKYMDNVMKESQRLYPSVPGFARKLTEDLQIGEYTLPKGTTIGVNTFLIHRDPDVYPDPEKFDPDRFSPENSTGRSPYALIPFSAGARNCLGQRYALQEEKVVLSHILRHFRVSSLDERDKILLKPAAVLKTEGPLRISFIPRE